MCNWNSEGIYQNAFVYINNSFGKKSIWIWKFLDATKYVHAGQNTIKVTENAAPMDAGHTGGGNHRDVNIMFQNRRDPAPGARPGETAEEKDPVGDLRELPGMATAQQLRYGDRNYKPIDAVCGKRRNKMLGYGLIRIHEEKTTSVDAARGSLN